MAYLAKTARASAKVVGSATVGPEPMTEGSSPGTSEMTRVTTRAGAAAAASRPPLMAERCLRTQFISVDRRPGFEQRPVDLLLVGEGQAGRRPAPAAPRRRPRSGRARDRRRVSPPTAARMRAAAAAPAASGTGWEASTTSMRLAGDAMAVAGDDQPAERPLPVVLDGARHGGGRLAGAHHHGAALGRRRQKRRDAARRVAGGERGVEHAAQQGARRSL